MNRLSLCLFFLKYFKCVKNKRKGVKEKKEGLVRPFCAPLVL